MTKYEKVYSFNVIDEIKSGEIIYIIDRSRRDSFAIREVNTISSKEMILLINDDNANNRFEFYKVVKVNE